MIRFSQQGCFRTVRVLFFLVLSLSLAGCGEKEPAQRQAFIAFLTGNVLTQKGLELPELTAADEKAFGGYADAYALLTSFQKAMAREGAKAGELLALTDIGDLAALARAEGSVRKAAGEARDLRKTVLALKEQSDRAKQKLDLPDDLAPVYNEAYAKVVALPAVASAETFGAAHAVFAAILDLLDFVEANSRDMEIVGKNINLKNIGLKEELQAKMALVREKGAALHRAYGEMAKTMLQ